MSIILNLLIMDKAQLIRSIEALHPDVPPTISGILEIVEQLEEVSYDTVIGEILVQFMCDDNTLFNIDDVNRILKQVLIKHV